MKTRITILFFLAIFKISAQKNGNIWYFGNTGAGLNFNTCSPVVLNNGWNNNQGNELFEGSTTMCDTNGTLLFYSNGRSVFNANHTIMPNGATVGNGNTMTQNIIIPKPGTTNIYYLFSPMIQAFGGPAIVRYSIIDMSLNGGLGSVTSSGNILRDTIGRRGTEKLTAIRHNNGSDIWLVGHDYYNNKFFAYLISSTGINPTPVETNSGPILTDPLNQSHYPTIGELKASPNGNKLGFTALGNGVTAIFDFNKTNGVVSNPINLSINDGGISCSGYGVSFSPDNSKLYVTSSVQMSLTGPTLHKLFQFNLSSWNTVSIQSSRSQLNSVSSTPYFSIKLGPNKKIYVSKGIPSTFLGVIHSPNQSGSLCNFIDQGLSLGGLQGSWGLNNVMEMFDSIAPPPPITLSSNISTVCLGSSIVLSANGASTYTWLAVASFSGSNSSSVVVTPTSSTSFSVSGTDTFNCVSSASLSIQVNPLPSLTLVSTPSLVCPGNSVLVTAAGANSYLWSSGLWSSGFQLPGIILNLNSTAVHTVMGIFSNSGCSSTQTVLTSVFITSASAGPSSTICSGSSAKLSAGGSNIGTYFWLNSGSNTQSIFVSPLQNTIYTVSASSSSSGVLCSSIATVQVAVNPSPTITAFASQYTVCENQQVVLICGGGITYTWLPVSGFPGANSSSVIVTPTSSVSFSVSGTSSLNCVSSASFSIQVNPLPSLTLVSTPSLVCPGNSVLVTAAGANSYTWSTGSQLTGIILNPNSTVVHTVIGIFSNSGCSSTQTVMTSVFITSVSVSPSTTICSGSSATLSSSGSNIGTYYWFNSGSNTQSISVSPLQNIIYTVSASSSSSGVLCSSIATVQVAVNPSPTITTFASQYTVCENQQVVLSCGGGITYTWLPVAGFPGSNSSSVIVSPTSSMSFSVSGTSSLNCVSSASFSIQVNPLPSITAFASQYAVCENQQVVLSCGGGITYTWTYPGGSSSSVPFIVFPVSNTTYTVIGSSMNGCENNSTVSVQVNNCSNIVAIEEAKPLNIFPNPTQGIISIENAGDCTVSIYDTRGWELLKTELQYGLPTLDLHDLSTGMYFLKIQSADRIEVRKIVKE